MPVSPLFPPDCQNFGGFYPGTVQYPALNMSLDQETPYTIARGDRSSAHSTPKRVVITAKGNCAGWAAVVGSAHMLVLQYTGPEDQSN
jgi:hypothetical protein